MTGRGSGRRGRPLGFRLSEGSKRAISQSKLGQKHRKDTKDKISNSLIMYFRMKHPLSEEIINKYCRATNDTLCKWVTEVQDELNLSMSILTDRSMRNRNRIELSCGANIELFGHQLTPELLLMFKESCEEGDVDLDEF